MGSKASSNPILFQNESGERLRFYLRPGPTKAEWQPVIVAYGGVVCRTQEPNTILLANQEEVAGLPPTMSHQYTSTTYVRDCVEQNKLLELEDYRLKSVERKHGKRKRAESGGRMGYTSEEDEAILAYIRGRVADTGGNQVWQQMERKKVTSHSWQSMKDRFRKHLFQRLHNHPVVDLKTPKNQPHKLEKTSDHPQDENICLLSFERVNDGQKIPYSPKEAPILKSSGKRKQKTNRIQRAMSDIEELSSSSPEEQEHEEQLSESESEQQRLDSSEEGDEQRNAIVVRKVKQNKIASPVKTGGILEAAIKEFEDSDLGNDVTSELASKCGSSPERDASNPVPNRASAAPEVTSANVNSSEQSGHQSDCLSPAKYRSPNKCQPTTSNVHMFLFESESQEQSEGEELADALPFSQAEVEETKQHVQKLMRRCDKDLITVTKALLKFSGDVMDAQKYLLGEETSGPCWKISDDVFLMSTDTAKHQLHLKYGKDAVAKRIAFLDTH